MNTKVIILWGFIVVCLILSIFFIGITNKEALRLSAKFDKEVKAAAKEYIEEEGLSIPAKFSSEDLFSDAEEYPLVDGNKRCTASISVKKILFVNNYDIRYTCERVDND